MCWDEETFTFLLAILISFLHVFGLVVLHARLSYLCYREALFLVLFVRCRWSLFILFIVAVVIGWANATELGARRADTPLACTDGGLLQ